MSLSLYIVLTVFNLSLLVFATIYIPKRLSGLFGIQKAKLHILCFAIITFVGIWGVLSAATTQNTILLNIFRITIIWLGFIIYLFFLLLVFEITRLFLKVDRKKIGVLIVSLSAFAVVYGFIHSRSYKIYEVDIPISNLQQEVKILHAPDMHLGPFRGKGTLSKFISDTKRLNPDFILLNGDLVDGLDGLETSTLDLLKEVTQPVFFTGGNHDEYVDLEALETTLTELGVRVLKNKIVNIKGIQLVGLNYMNADDKVYDAHASSRTETIEMVVEQLALDPAIPSVFVHHSPVGIQYMEEAGADLILSGHTHAGQFFPATLIASIQFEFLKGLYQIGNAALYVSQGIGTFGPPIRVGTEGEATLITMIPK